MRRLRLEVDDENGTATVYLHVPHLPTDVLTFIERAFDSYDPSEKRALLADLIRA